MLPDEGRRTKWESMEVWSRAASDIQRYARDLHYSITCDKLALAHTSYRTLSPIRIKQMSGLLIDDRWRWPATEVTIQYIYLSLTISTPWWDSSSSEQPHNIIFSTPPCDWARPRGASWKSSTSYIFLWPKTKMNKSISMPIRILLLVVQGVLLPIHCAAFSRYTTSNISFSRCHSAITRIRASRQQSSHDAEPELVPMHEKRSNVLAISKPEDYVKFLEKDGLCVIK